MTIQLIATDMYPGLGEETIVDQVFYLTAADMQAAYTDYPMYEQVMRMIQIGEAAWAKLVCSTAMGLPGQPPSCWTSCLSPRPYILGYGCDGTVDANIHYLTSLLAEGQGLDVGRLYREAYPDSEGPVFPEYIAAETFVPPAIDTLVLIDELLAINNSSLAEVLAHEWVTRGLLTEEWPWIRSGPAFQERKQQLRWAYRLRQEA